MVRQPSIGEFGGLFALPDGIDTETAAGIGCRFTTSYHGMARQADVGNGEDVVVYGLGGIGLSAVQIIGVDLTRSRK